MTARTLLILIIAFDTAAVALAVFMGANIGKYLKYFGESRFLTKISLLQLLAVSWLSFKVYLSRRSSSSGSGPRSPGFIWLLISTGFLFLAADERWEFHEKFDKWLHRFFGMMETGITDRIDDLIIVMYAAIGLCFLYFYFRVMQPGADFSGK